MVEGCEFQSSLDRVEGIGRFNWRKTEWGELFLWAWLNSIRFWSAILRQSDHGVQEWGGRFGGGHFRFGRGAGALGVWVTVEQPGSGGNECVEDLARAGHGSEQGIFRKEHERIFAGNLRYWRGLWAASPSQGGFIVPLDRRRPVAANNQWEAQELVDLGDDGISLT